MMKKNTEAGDDMTQKERILNAKHCLDALALGLDPATGAVVGEDITAQAKQVLENLKAVLEASGAALDTVLKTTCFLADMADFAPFNELYAAYFTGCPARSCVAVKQLPKGVLVEVEAIAAVR